MPFPAGRYDPMHKLAVLSGPTKGTIYALADPSISIGRADGNSIVIEDTEISRHHALLIADGDDYRIRDLNSANGTWVNGQGVTEARLQPGDTVRIGGVEFAYRPDAARTGRGARLAAAARPIVAVLQPPAAAPAAGKPPAPAQPVAAPAPVSVLPPLATAPRRSRLWLAVAVTCIVCWAAGGLLLWATGVWPARQKPAAPTGDRPGAAAREYRDRHGRFTCLVPAGWAVEADPEDPRSAARFHQGDAEVRVIAQPTDQTGLGEADRAAAAAVFRGIAEKAGASDPGAVTLATRWRELDGTRVLEVEFELRAPSYLWMRQIKFRRDGVDHTIAAYAGSASARSEVGRVFEQYLAGYQPAAGEGVRQ